MLSPPDAELARRDTAIPGLALLLDVDAFADALRTSLPEVEVGEVRSTYVRYKPGTNCLVAYQLAARGAWADVYAKAFRTDSAGKLGKARQRLAAAGGLGPGGVVLGDVATVVFVFPNDYKLDPLAGLVGSGSRPAHLAEILPDRPDLWNTTLRNLHYKPERRYVAQMTNGAGPRALLKVYARGEYLRAMEGVDAFKTQGPLRVPRRIGHSEQHRAIVLEWLPGERLSDAVCSAQFDPNAVRAVGEGLAALHAQPAPALRFTDQAHQAASLFAAAGAVAATSPRLGERADDLAHRLAAGLPCRPDTVRAIHGDFSADQVLLADDTVAIIDFDTAARGDPLDDLASFAAWLEYQVVLDNLSDRRATAVTRALFEGYWAAQKPQRLDSFELHVAAGLLRLAPHPFRYRDADWPSRTEAILDRVQILLLQAGSRAGG